jgi:glycosyltransferase involved in cell wall biosynthesis
VTDAPAGSPRRVVLVCDASGPQTGLGRYWRMVHEGLGRAGLESLPIMPTLPPLPEATYQLMRLLGRDLRALLTNYPMWCSYPEADIYHLMTQTLGSLLLLRKPSAKVVVTVHDIFPYMLRNERWFRHMTNTDRLFHGLAMLGLKRADHLIAISAYTKRCLVELLGIAPEKITVIHHGIDPERFRPVPVPGWVREKYQLPEGRRYLLYVGSEDPRKKLATLVHALAQVRHRLPDVELIKAGRSHFENERRSLVELAEELGVRAAIHFLEDIPEEHLPLLYNLAELYVTPSPYEGFGFPVLEAMACGIPVVYANAGSLPEIAGTAGIAVTPGDSEGLANALLRVLTYREQQSAMRTAGRERAAEFTWTGTTDRILTVYRRMIQAHSDDSFHRSKGSSDQRHRPPPLAGAKT